MRLSRFGNSDARHVVIMALPLIAIALGEVQVLKATLQEYVRWSQGFIDVPEQIEQRFAPLRPVLPKYGYVGYLDPDHSDADADATRVFYLAQYALAPAVLITSTEPEYVVYSSRTGRPLRADATPPGMRVLIQPRPDLAVLTRSR